MKISKIISLFAALLFTASAFAAIPPKIFDAINVGNSSELAKYFNSSVELVIIDSEAVYSKQQAEQIVKSFFDKNHPKEFTLLHQGGKGDAQYAIGTLVSEQGKKFRVYFLVKEKSNNPLIHQMRIEEEK